MRQHHVAGDKVFVDYSGTKIAIVDPRTGEIRQVRGLQLHLCGGDVDADPAALDRHPCADVPFLRGRSPA